jgi:hypothetical protein
MQPIGAHRIFIPVILNLSVHAVMYSYYFLQTVQKFHFLPKFVVFIIDVVCKKVAVFITCVVFSCVCVAFLPVLPLVFHRIALAHRVVIQCCLV